MIVIQDIIPINQYSRPERKLQEIMGIVVHWPQWAGASAKRVRDYFANDIKKEHRYGSAHYCVDDTIVQCIPEDEMAYHCGSLRPDPASGKIYTDLARAVFGEYASSRLSPNMVSIGIEICHIDSMGAMKTETVRNVIELVATLCATYNLDPSKQVLRHYDVVGWKVCPRWWVNHPESWQSFIQSVEEFAT
jgi:N-acetylmuramoyl-L-alanine amidase